MMQFSVTFTQFVTLRDAAGQQALVIYALNVADPTIVERVTLLDPKLGGVEFNWIDPALAPLEATFLLSFPQAIKVEAIG